MDATLPARRDFLTLARNTLVRFGAESTALDTPQWVTDAQVGIEFVVEDVTFRFVHSTDAPTDKLLLITCVFGPWRVGAEHETCMQVLAANYELSPLLLTGFAMDEGRDLIFTHSCAIPLWDDDRMAGLIESMAALALQWRRDGILNADGLVALKDQSAPAFTPALA